MPHSWDRHFLLPACGGAGRGSLLLGLAQDMSLQNSLLWIKTTFAGMNNGGAFGLPPILQEEGSGPPFANSFTMWSVFSIVHLNLKADPLL